MNRIGIAGLDTSHAEAFASVIDDLEGLTVDGVWDRADVRDEGYIESFCDEYDATRYSSPEEMAAGIDAAMVLTVDWEDHAPLASIFLDAGLPTMVDKPVAGSVGDVETLRAAARGSRLFGGSAVPHHDAFSSFPRGGQKRTIYAAGYNDFFYYRVHLTDTVRFLADANWSRVTPSEEPGSTVDVIFENGLYATLRFDGSPDDGTFSVLDVADTTNVIEVQSNQDALTSMYEPFLTSFRSVVEGERDDSGRVLDSATLILAVEGALKNDAVVTPDSETLASISIESSEFVADYDPYY